MPASFVALMLVGAGMLLVFAWFALVSWREREPRASVVALLVGLASGGLCAGSAMASEAGRIAVLALLAAIAVAICLLPSRRVVGSGRPSRRVDERTIMFARRRLVPGSPEHESYYALHPEHRDDDDRTRELPGLLSPEAAKAEPIAFASAAASFGVTEALRDAVDGDVAADRLERPAEDGSVMVKRLARYYGAVDAGVTELRPYHVYSHVGRGSGTWGEPIELDHRFAIAFTVEMEHSIMHAAPEAPVVAESARQYVASGLVAVQLAAAIRALGHSARAHIDGNYRVIAPLVARDAGLGEIGRMGLLMTPALGPRVRLGVVTTDLPLVSDPAGDNESMLAFCTSCKKCADNCPSLAIPTGDREPVDEGSRWAIDADACFRYWNAVGSDCAKCMTVCPYSHPDNVAHDLVRWAIRRSSAAQRAAMWMDDLFYGRRPATKGLRGRHDLAVSKRE